MVRMPADVERLLPMKRRSPAPSARLLRAVAAEREDLRRRRTELLERRRQLQAELGELDAAVTDVDERLLHIDRLAADQPSGPSTNELPASAHPAPPSAEAREELRGPAIRATAVKVLLAHPQRPEALHYREWFALLNNAGYSIAGKDPLAVFLTQLSRSPLVRRSTQSGVYQLDLEAPTRLHFQLENLQTQLRALTTKSPSSTTDLTSIRNTRSDLTRQIDRAEKAVQEAEATLRHATEHADLAAAS